MIACVVGRRGAFSMRRCFSMHWFRDAVTKLVAAGTIFLLSCCGAFAQRTLHYVCTAGASRGDRISLSTTAIYGEAKQPSDGIPAYGFDLGTVPGQIVSKSCSSGKPFFFSVAAHDGDYRVTLVLGGPAASVEYREG